MPAQLGFGTSASASDANPRRYSAEEMRAVARHSMAMAKVLARPDHEEMLELAKKSTDMHHRVAAAWAMGIACKHDCGLTALLSDGDPLVVLAARESCVHLARGKYADKAVDFGPTPSAGSADKKQAQELWETYFEKRIALLARQQKAQPGVKAPLVERLGAGAKPDVYDIRNLPRGKD